MSEYFGYPQNEEERYWAERAAYEQQCEEEQRRKYEEEYLAYYDWMPRLFWYAGGFYDNTPAGEGEEE